MSQVPYMDQQVKMPVMSKKQAMRKFKRSSVEAYEQQVEQRPSLRTIWALTKKHKFGLMATIAFLEFLALIGLLPILVDTLLGLMGR